MDKEPVLVNQSKAHKGLGDTSTTPEHQVLSRLARMRFAQMCEQENCSFALGQEWSLRTESTPMPAMHGPAANMATVPSRRSDTQPAQLLMTQAGKPTGSYQDARISIASSPATRAR
jgi:hypothetical protein